MKILQAKRLSTSFLQRSVALESCCHWQLRIRWYWKLTSSSSLFQLTQRLLTEQSENSKLYAALEEMQKKLDEKEAELVKLKDENGGLKWHVAVLEGAGSSCGFSGDVC